MLTSLVKFDGPINKVPRPDDYLAKFYQHFLKVINAGIWHCLMRSIKACILPLHCLNLGIITLLLENAEATMTQKYRPICLFNLIFKIFAKVLNNRIHLI